MIKRILQLAFILLILSGCSDLQVLTSYDDDADFTSYLTFGVVNYDTTSQVSGRPTGFVDGYFKSAIEKEMKNRGYLLSDNRDLEVYYYLKLSTETQLVASTSPSYGAYYGSPYYYGYYGGYGYGAVGVSIGSSTTSVYEVDHTEGTLIIDIVDVRANKVVWQGTARKSVDDSGSVKREIDEVISRIFHDYRWTVGEVAEGKKKKK